jgi:hypothetical protein
MKYLPPVFIGGCVVQFVGNMKYLPPVFIGVCVAQFVGNMKYLPPVFIEVCVAATQTPINTVVSISCLPQIEQHKPQ